MLDVLALIPSAGLGFDVEWLHQVFGDLNVAYLLLAHPSTLVFMDPDAGEITIRQNGLDVPLEARSYLYLPATFERQHTILQQSPADRYSDFVAREWHVITTFLEYHLGRTSQWINPPQCSHKAANKLLQIVSAISHGLPIPPTIVTNDPTQVSKVMPNAASRGIYKPIGESGRITEDVMAPTSFFTMEEITSDPSSIRVAPGCFQAYIPAELELRTHIFGRKAVSVAIRPRDKSRTPDLSCQDLKATDFFIDESHKSYESRLIELVSSFGLTYAAADSLIAGGECYFLEINPSGTWGWLPEEIRAILNGEFRKLLV